MKRLIKNKFGEISSVEPYIPEHVRLNLTPRPVNPHSLKEDFKINQINLPSRQMKVNSGQNVESHWLAQPPVQSKTPFYNEPLASQPIKDFSNKEIEKINSRDVQMPDDWDNHVEENSNDFNSVIIGDYVLIYDNDILTIGSDIEISNIIEEILTSDKYNIDQNKLSVMKKMNVKTGVLISD